MVLSYLIIAGLVAVNYLVLYRTGELEDLPDIVAEQQKRDGLYNAYSIGFAAYKYETYRQRQPEIVAIGNSRSLNIRDYFFAQKFFNIGGLALNPIHAFSLMDQLLVKHPPKAVFFTVEYSTFCALKKEYPPFVRPNSTFHPGQGDPESPLLLWQLYLDDQLSNKNLSQLFQHLIKPQQPVVPRTGLGTVIVENHIGADGSLFYFEPITTLDVKDRSRHDINVFNQNTGLKAVGCTFSERNLVMLRMLGTELAEHGIDLIVILPPSSSALMQVIEKNPDANTFLNEWRRRVKEVWPQTYDFTDPRTFGSSDCEFFDGIHGGEVVYARIFRKLAEYEPERIAPLLNLENLDHVIAIGKDKVIVALGFPENVRKHELRGILPCSPS